MNPSSEVSLRILSGAETHHFFGTYTRRHDSVKISPAARRIFRKLDLLKRDSLFGGRRPRPAEGDRIEHWVGSTKYTYEVMPLGTDSHYRPVGSYGKSWRIHSKLVGQSG